MLNNIFGTNNIIPTETAKEYDSHLDVLEMGIALNKKEFQEVQDKVDTWKMHYEFLYGREDLSATLSGSTPHSVKSSGEVYKYGKPYEDARLNIAAADYRADHDKHDEWAERLKAARKVCYFNRVCRTDPAIRGQFLDRKYRITDTEENLSTALADAALVIARYDEMVADMTARNTARMEMVGAKAI